MSVRDDARQAATRGAWSDAADLYARLDPGDLAAEDLIAIADAHWWRCELSRSIGARQSAHNALLSEGDLDGAAYQGWLIAQDHWMKGERAVASGWFRRSLDLLVDRPHSVARGFLALTESDIARDAGDHDVAAAAARLAIDLGKRHGSEDLHAMGVQTLGRAMIVAGRSVEGMSLLDEAMTFVVSGRLRPLFTGWVYCNVLAACMERADLGRATEWTEAAIAWCGSIGELTPYHGICRVHRAEIAAMRGEWEHARSEALRAAEELGDIEQQVVAEAMYAVGEIHLGRGDLEEAEGWFGRARELGRDPQPGLAMIRLAHGKVDVAATGIRLALEDAVAPTLHRARLLSAQAEVAIAAGDLDAARGAAEGLEAVRRETPSALLEAGAEMTWAALAVAEADHATAIRRARAAWSMWRRLKLPRFEAKTRMILGEALRVSGDLEGAQTELEAARSAFERLGARPEAAAASDKLRGTSTLPRGLSERELEVLRLVAAGKTNREIAAEMVISEHTVSRHLQNIFRKLEVSTRAAATAFAFENALV